MKRDYYEILGLAKGATAQEIKKKYRSLALKHHPDRVPEEKKKESEEKFKEISEAYGVLSDPQKRKMYDQYGHAGIDQRYTAEDIFRGANFEDLGLGDIFEQFFGGGGGFESIFGGGFGGGGRRRAQRGADIRYEVELSLEDAFKGIQKDIKVPRHEKCKTCSGSGAKPGTSPKTCTMCQGQGQVMTAMGPIRMAQTCPTCHGKGTIIETPCSECHGNGLVRVTRKIEVNIPAGVDNDSRLRVRNEGEAGEAGPGDLYLYIYVKPHATFHRDGKDLQMDLPVSFTKAALGGEVSVPTLNGSVSMKVPSGTQSGKIFRLKEKGMPDLHGRGAGNLYTRVMVKVPTHLNADQKRLLKEFAESSGEEFHEQTETFADKIKKVFK